MSDTVRKTVAFLSTRPPAGGDVAQACLEAALSFAVFEQKVLYIFIDDGIWQLLTFQSPMDGGKTIGAALGALDIYGINKVYACAQSMSARKVLENELIDGVEVAERSVISDLINSADSVFTF